MSLEKKIIFISSSSSFIGEALINHYKKKRFFIISYSENTKFFKNKNHINFNKKLDLSKYFSKISSIHYAYLNHGLIGGNHAIHKLINSHIQKTKFILRILQKINIQRLIYFRSSDEDPNYSNENNNMSFNPINFYGTIKSITTNIIYNHCYLNKQRFTFFKLYLVVGNKQKFPRILKLIKNKIENNLVLNIEDAYSIKNFTDIEDFLIIQEKIIQSDHFIDKSIDLVSDQNISIGELCKKIKKIYPQFKFIRNRKNTKKVLIPKLTYLKKIFDKYDFKKIDQIIKECI